MCHLTSVVEAELAFDCLKLHSVKAMIHIAWQWNLKNIFMIAAISSQKIPLSIIHTLITELLTCLLGQIFSKGRHGDGVLLLCISSTTSRSCILHQVCRLPSNACNRRVVGFMNHAPSFIPVPMPPRACRSLIYKAFLGIHRFSWGKVDVKWVLLLRRRLELIFDDNLLGWGVWCDLQVICLRLFLFKWRLATFLH